MALVDALSARYVLIRGGVANAPRNETILQIFSSLACSSSSSFYANRLKTVKIDCLKKLAGSNWRQEWRANK